MPDGVREHFEDVDEMGPVHENRWREEVVGVNGNMVCIEVLT